jgi:hypothetical protein
MEFVEVNKRFGNGKSMAFFLFLDRIGAGLRPKTKEENEIYAGRNQRNIIRKKEG